MAGHTLFGPPSEQGNCALEYRPGAFHPQGTYSKGTGVEKHPLRTDGTNSEIHPPADGTMRSAQQPDGAGAVVRGIYCCPKVATGFASELERPGSPALV